MTESEMEMIRAASVELDENTMFVLTYQYHTEKDPDDPAGKRNDRSKSRYRMLGRVETKAEFERIAAEKFSDANRLEKWKWPDDPSWDGEILYSGDSTNRRFSSWIKTKLKKAVNWETYLRILDGFKRDPKQDRNLPKNKKNPELMYSIECPGAKYEKTGYSCSDGSTIDVSDREALLSKVGQNVWKEIEMKLAGPKRSAAE